MSVTVTCTHCQKAFEAERATAKFCSGACKVAFSRGNKKRPTPIDVLEAVPKPKSVVPSDGFSDWLASRCAELGCAAQTMKVNYFTETIQIPVKWTLEDIDYCLSHSPRKPITKETK